MSRLKKALEKAKKEYPKVQVYNDDQKEISKITNLENKTSSRDEVKVEYSHTKVQKVSPQQLRKNKIFALFPEYRISNRIKTLRTQILKKLEKVGSNAFMVTSANPGEGKTFTSINLGVSISQELDRTVLIVDADLKNPAKDHFSFADDFFSVDVKLGLADVLLGKCNLDHVLINPGIDKLTLLPGGTYLDNSSELLGSPQMESLVNDLIKKYKDRIVIFDTPAVLSCADPVQLSKFVENLLFVVEEERTNADDVKKAINLFSDIHLIGMILNKSKSK